MFPASYSLIAIPLVIAMGILMLGLRYCGIDFGWFSGIVSGRLVRVVLGVLGPSTFMSTGSHK